MPFSQANRWFNQFASIYIFYVHLDVHYSVNKANTVCGIHNLHKVAESTLLVLD